MGIWTGKAARRKNDEWVGGESLEGWVRIDGRADGAEQESQRAGESAQEAMAGRGTNVCDGLIVHLEDAERFDGLEGGEESPGFQR